jgi:hypothetical protein
MLVAGLVTPEMLEMLELQEKVVAEGQGGEALFSFGRVVRITVRSMDLEGAGVQVWAVQALPATPGQRGMLE